MIVLDSGGLQVPLQSRPGNPPRPGASLAGMNLSSLPDGSIRALLGT
jgi:hypothetical protein